jgi:tyrosine-protein kinase Etk/Wzc
MTLEPRLDLVVLLVRRWLVLAICALLGAAAGFGYGLLAPQWFEARLTVVASQHSTNPALGMLANLPGADALGVSGSTDVQRIQAVLESTSVLDEVIAKFTLGERYGTAHIEQTRQELAKHCSTGVDRKSGVVSLSCEDKEPEQAMAMATFFGEVGNRVFGRISASSAREERRFLETQVQSARKDVDLSSQKLREFQETHRVVDLGEQSKAVISAMAVVEGQLVSKQLELSYLERFSSRTEVNVVQFEQQIAIMKAKLAELEDSQRPHAGSAAPDPGGKFFPDAMRVPELRFQLEQLLREQKIQETVFFLLMQRYETAKVDEARDTSTFQILDNPTLPTYKSRPKRGQSLLLGVACGVAFGCAAIILPVAWRRRRAMIVS